MRVHKYEYADESVYVFPFFYVECRGPENSMNYAGSAIGSFSWSKVTCKRCLKARKR
jgi:hypothetical protein